MTVWVCLWVCLRDSFTQVSILVMAQLFLRRNLCVCVRIYFVSFGEKKEHNHLCFVFLYLRQGNNYGFLSFLIPVIQTRKKKRNEKLLWCLLKKEKGGVYSAT